MGTYKSNRKNQLSSSNKAASEYDLSSSFKKIKNYSKRGRQSDSEYISSESDSQYSNNKNHTVSSSEVYSPETSTGQHLWNNYYRLEDKFSNYTSQNENAHTDLRRELEKKIDDAKKEIMNSIKDIQIDIKEKLPIQWYIWTIIGLVAIATIWYTFSYSTLLNNQEKVEKEIVNIHNSQNSLEHEIKNISTNITRIEQDNNKKKQHDSNKNQ